MTKKFTTEKQFWTALSKKSQELIIQTLENILPKEITTDTDYQVIIKSYQDSYYAEETLSKSEPMINLIARDYLQVIKARIAQVLTSYEEN